MEQYSNNNIYERTSNIPIINKKKFDQKYEQSLNTIFFDPSSHSPPNLFVEKLTARMIKHSTKIVKKTVM